MNVMGLLNMYAWNYARSLFHTNANAVMYVIRSTVNCNTHCCCEDVLITKNVPRILSIDLSKSIELGYQNSYKCFDVPLLRYQPASTSHSGPENLKITGQKNLWNQINQFHEMLFWPNSIFCHFKNGSKSIFELGKSLKLPKMQFHEKKLVYLISRVFWPIMYQHNLIK